MEDSRPAPQHTREGSAAGARGETHAQHRTQGRQHTRRRTEGRGAPQAMHGPRPTAATAAATGQRRDPAREARHQAEDPFPKTKPQQTPNPLTPQDFRPIRTNRDRRRRRCPEG